MMFTEVLQRLDALMEGICELEALLSRLKNCRGIEEKIAVLLGERAVCQSLSSSSSLSHFLRESTQEQQLVVYELLAIKQGPIVFEPLFVSSGKGSVSRKESNAPIGDVEIALWKDLVAKLVAMEHAYRAIGGIIGYQISMLKLLRQHHEGNGESRANESYAAPEGIDLTQDNIDVRRSVRWGIESIPHVAEMYPIGGAGDRLSLQDEATGEALPAAELPFCGYTLLETLVRDLQGREYLHYKLYGKQVITPIAAMTSEEKHNHEKIVQRCVQQHWFGRPPQSFKFFLQPLVPMLTEDGNWAMQGPMRPYFKPGGHGVIWKLAIEEGVFDWLSELGYEEAIVRQINNPVAGIDLGLLALAGIGYHNKKSMGFASCDRLLKASEGMNVLIERPQSQGMDYVITNIEYTDFSRYGIVDAAVEKGSAYSQFPANTNILYVNLKAIQEAAARLPLPGMLINLKSTINCYLGNGHYSKLPAARLESTMQNIADVMVDHFPKKLKKCDQNKLKTFLTYNARQKTISVTKHSYAANKPFDGSPEGCFYVLMQNYRDLLQNYCGMELPSFVDQESYLKTGPSYVVLFHPAMGPLFNLMAQKIKGGSLAEGAEWVMEIAEAYVEQLKLEGSLLVMADAVMGKKDEEGVYRYDAAQAGKCRLSNVHVKNKGQIQVPASKVWKRHLIERKEFLSIFLHGNAEIDIRDVTLEGNLFIEVFDGERLEIFADQGKIVQRRQKLVQPTWQWSYEFDEHHRIQSRMIQSVTE